VVILILVGLVVLIVGWRLSRHPMSDRTWIPDQQRSPKVRFAGDLVHIQDLRDADPRSRAPVWLDRTYDLRTLDSVWLVVAPFSEGWRGPAHTFVTFGFGEREYVGVSVEARREEGEEYGVVTGAFDRFEVLYVIGTEHDLVGRRAFDAAGPLYLYPIRATPEAIRTLFVSMLTRADALGTRPEFYNTLTNNCTSNLLGHVQPLIERRIPSGLLTVLPGYADDVAKKLDLIADDAGIDTVRARYRIDERARAALDSADFSTRIRAR
jgi:uncharacterized protein DUF4105